jgi:hypothetical protein
MDKNGDTIVNSSGFIFIINGADVNFLLIAHYHHLPLGLVLRDAAVLRPTESLIAHIFAANLGSLFDQYFISIFCLLHRRQHLATPEYHLSFILVKGLFFRTLTSLFFQDIRVIGRLFLTFYHVILH